MRAVFFSLNSNDGKKKLFTQLNTKLPVNIVTLTKFLAILRFHKR